MPKLPPALEVSPPQHRAERDNPLPGPTGYAGPGVPQNRDVPPGCQGIADSYPTFHLLGFPGPFAWCCSLASHSPACPYIQGCTIPSAQSGTFPRIPLLGWWLSSPPMCPGLSAVSLYFTGKGKAKWIWNIFLVVWSASGQTFHSLEQPIGWEAACNSSRAFKPRPAAVSDWEQGRLGWGTNRQSEDTMSTRHTSRELAPINFLQMPVHLSSGSDYKGSRQNSSEMEIHFLVRALSACV